MSDKFITVATFNKGFEAQLAKSLLENEGIASMVGGAISSDMLFGSLALGDQIVLQVREEDAQRAAGVLASAEAEARLDDDWEEKAEADVWICSICGEPISNRLSMCYSCQSPKDSIRAAVPRDSVAIQTDLTPMPTSRDIAEKPTPTIPVQKSSSASMPPEDDDENEPLTKRGDDLARKAFLASIFAVVMPILLPVAWIMLLRAAFATDGTSAEGSRYFYAVLFLNVVTTGILYFAFAAWFR